MNVRYYIKKETNMKQIKIEKYHLNGLSCQKYC